MRPALCNQHLTEYRDRNLRDSLLEELVEKLHGKFNKEDIKREWHNLQTVYKRKKSREESSKVSGSGSCDIYCSTWEHFSQMEFIDVTGDTDASCTSLDRAYTPPVQKKRKPSRTSEDDAKIELWKPLAASLKPQDNVIAKKWIVRTCHFIWKGCRRFSFEICPKGVVLFEKEGDDVFYDYEQHKSISHSTYPNSPSYLANQFIQENNLQPAHFMNMFSNVSNNGMQMNQYSHTKTSISQNNEFYPFSPVSTCLNDSYWYFKHTVKEKHCNEFLYYIITVLYQFDSFSQRVGLVDIKGHYYFLMLFFLWKM